MNWIISRFCLVLLIVLMTASRTTLEGISISNQLVGPIIAIQHADEIVIQDIGSNVIKHFQVSTFQDVNISWTPDGCNIVFADYNHSTNEFEFFTLNVFSSDLQPLSNNGTPYWSPNGSYIAFVKYSKQEEHYVVTLTDSMENALFTFPFASTISPKLTWMSNHEIGFKDSKYIYKFDIVEKSLSKTDVDLDVARVLISAPHYFTTSISPDLQSFVGYDSPMLYYPSVDSDEANSSEVPNSMTELKSSLSIYQYEDINKTMEVELLGNYVSSVAWSPSSSKLAIESFYRGTPDADDGYYVFDIPTSTLQRVGDIPAWRLTFESVNSPAWSYDESWLAISTQDSAIAYNLMTDDIIRLGFTGDGWQIPMYWSPVMDYSQSKNKC